MELDWAGLMARTGTKPLVVPKDSRSGEDVRKEYAAWRQKHVVQPQLEQLKGAADESPMRAFLEKAEEQWAHDAARPIAPDLVKQAVAIINGDARRPVIDFLAAYVCKQSEEMPTALKGERYVVNAPAEPAFPSLLRVLAQSVVLRETDRHQPRKVPEEAKRYFAVLEAHLAQATDDEDARWIVYHHLNSVIITAREKREPEHIERYRAAKLPEWARLTLVGEAERELSWRYAGKGWGHPEKPAEVKPHWEEAAKQFTRAWELKPTVPYAAEKMITVTSVGDGDADALRQWFDRALAAEFDSQPAFRSYLDAIRPYWGGSFEKLVAFGRSCAETQRYDSNLPTQFNRSVNETAYNLDDWRPLYRHPEISKLLLETRERRMNVAPESQMRKLVEASELCVEAWAAGNLELASRALDVVRSPEGAYLYEDDGGRIAYDLGVDWKLVFSDIMLHRSPAHEAFAAGQTAAKKRKYDEAIQFFKKALPDAPKEAVARVNGEVVLAEFQRQYDKAEWTSIPVQEPNCWSQWDGENLWDAASKRVKLTGNWVFGMSLFRAPLGTHFEVRGHFKTDGHMPRAAGWALYCGHSPLYTGRGNTFWWTVRIDTETSRTNAFRLAPKFDGGSEKNPVSIEAKDDTSFLFRRDGGRISFFVDDREVLHEKQIDEDAPGGECAWGLGVLGQGKGAAAWVWDLEARRLDRPL